MTVPNPPVPEEESAESLILFQRERERKRVWGNSFFEVNCALLKHNWRKKKWCETKGFACACLRLSLSVCMCMCYKLFCVSLKCVEDSMFVSPNSW